jgi:hypothetical protein
VRILLKWVVLANQECGFSFAATEEPHTESVETITSMNNNLVKLVNGTELAINGLPHCL